MYKAVGTAIVAGIGICVVLLVVAVVTCIGSLNTEQRLRNAVVAKSSANEASLDAMWKIIQQKAQISQQAASSIKDLNSVYQDLVQGRAGGALLKMVTEAYPNAGQAELAAIYQDLMRSVEAERKTFKTDQMVLQDLLRERENARTTFPASLIIGMFGGREAGLEFLKKGDAKTPDDWPLQYVWVTSGATKQMTSSGEENSLDLFSKSAAEAR
jgi:hypothetical protein